MQISFEMVSNAHVHQLTVSLQLAKKKIDKKEKKKNRVEFDYLERAVNDGLFTGAIPLLFDARAFACCVTTLSRFAPL